MRAVCRKSNSGVQNRPDCVGVSRARASHDVKRAGAEPDVGRRAQPRRRSGERPAGPPSDEQRPAVLQAQHVRCRGAPAVRHELASGDARPGIRTDAVNDDAQHLDEPHARLPVVDAERVPLRLDDGQGRPDQPEPGRRLRRIGGPAWRDERSARRRLSADHDTRAVQHDGRSDDLHLPEQHPLRALRQRHARSRQSPGQVRRLLLQSHDAARATRQRPRGVHLHRAVHRERVRRFPAWLPDVGDLRHRTRRRGRPNQLDARLRAGRLADAQQPDRERRPALRIQPAHVGREQPAVVGRSRDAGRAVRDCER